MRGVTGCVTHVARDAQSVNNLPLDPTPLPAPTPNPALKRTVAGGAHLRSLWVLFASVRPTGNCRLTQR